MAINPKVFKQVRKALGLSQQELADAIGLSRVTINKMERGRLRRGIPDEIAERLMSLKPKKPLEAKPVYFKQERTVYIQKPDDHLWDNEEDES